VDKVKTEKIALFDLDGTLADFDGAMQREMLKLASPGETDPYPREQETEPEHIRDRRRLVKRQPGFWSKLEMLPLGEQLLYAALNMGYQISILTKAPRTNFPAWSEKVEWCHSHLPMHRNIQVNLVEDKSLVYGRILVDDWPPYVSGWLGRRPRGAVIMPAHPWNEGFEEAYSQVIRCDPKVDFSVKRAMEVMAEQFARE